MLGVFLLVSGLLLVSCGGKAPPEVVPAAESAPSLTPTPSPIDVNALYAGRCATCHGEKRQGSYGRGGALTPESLAGRSDPVIREVIAEGIPYTNMPAWKGRLSAEEINAVVQFLKYTSP